MNKKELSKTSISGKRYATPSFVGEKVVAFYRHNTFKKEYTTEDGTFTTIPAHYEYFFENEECIFVVKKTKELTDIVEWVSYNLVAKEYLGKFYWTISEFDKDENGIEWSSLTNANADWLNEHIGQTVEATLIYKKPAPVFLDKELQHNPDGSIKLDPNKYSICFINKEKNLCFRKIISCRAFELLGYKIGTNYKISIKNLKNKATGSYYLGYDVSLALPPAPTSTETPQISTEEEKIVDIACGEQLEWFTDTVKE